MEKYNITESHLKSFHHLVSLYMESNEEPTKTFREFLMDEVIFGVQNCADKETGKLIEEDVLNQVREVQEAREVLEVLSK